jgi:PAS domain-containing protein
MPRSARLYRAINSRARSMDAPGLGQQEHILNLGERGGIGILRSSKDCTPITLNTPQIATGEWPEQLLRFEAALQHMSQGLCMFDHNSRLVVCNHRYKEIFDIPEEFSLFGKTQDEICRLLFDHGRYSSSITLSNIREATRTALTGSRPLPIFRELADSRVLSVLYRVIEGGGWVSTFEDGHLQKPRGLKGFVV